MKKRLDCSMGKNLKMSPEVYALRRQVMDHVYEAKNLLRSQGIQMDRVDIRVTDDSGNGALGMARLNDRIIWISLSSLKRWKAHLRDVVFHELVHTLTGFDHDDNCRLMCPCVNLQPLEQQEADALFLKYFTKR